MDNGPHLQTAQEVDERGVQPPKPCSAELTEEVQTPVSNRTQLFSREDLLSVRAAMPQSERSRQQQQQQLHRQQQLQTLHDIVLCVHSSLAHTDDTVTMDTETLHDFCRRDLDIDGLTRTPVCADQFLIDGIFSFRQDAGWCLQRGTREASR